MVRAWDRPVRAASVAPLAAVLVAILWPGPFLRGQDFKKQYVAVLFPFGSTVSGTGVFDSAIKSVPFPRDVVFNPEYLEGDGRDSRFEDSLVHYLRTKYASQRVDAVMPVGFPGLSFALRHGVEIFGDVPFVFVGVEQSRLDGQHLPPQFTGVTHVDDVRGTIEVALALQPDTTEVVVVAGTSQYDQYWLRHDRLLFEPLGSRVRFRYLEDLPMLALLRELSRLKPHTIVFFHAFSRDGAGQEFGGSDVLDLITNNTNAPLYGLIAREGFVGGRPSGDDDRRYLLALHMVRRILSGEKVSDIPMQQAKSGYPYAFNAKQLRRWNIDTNRIPAGSVLLNQEPSFWQRHRKLVLSVSLFMALESALVAVLLIQRARRRKAEALLADRNARLQESEHSLRQLSGQLIGAQEDERKRIARELHDDLNQQVAHLGISLSNIKRAVPTSLESVRGELVSVQNGLLTLSDGLRNISHELHPGILELVGLVAALKSHCREFSTVTSIAVEFESNCNQPVAPDVALCVYRIAQESLRNVSKHARASKVQVRLTRSGNLLRLTISDDGIGFDVQEARTRGGLGLCSMKERIWLIRGNIDLTSQPGSGTTLTATIGLNPPRDASAAVRTTEQETE